LSQETSVANPYTAGLARFVASLRYEDIPAEVKERIKLLMLDSLGCAIFGPSSSGAAF
jgi:2-methylcitrate dehydratase PrpD